MLQFNTPKGSVTKVMLMCISVLWISTQNGLTCTHDASCAYIERSPEKGVSAISSTQSLAYNRYKLY